MAMTVSVVTRTEVLYEGPGERVVIPAQSGEIGILTGHEPVFGVVSEGTVRVTVKDQTHRFKVDAGIFSVDSDVVTVAAHSGSVAGE